MPHDLEFPGEKGVPDWEALYLARGDEVVHHRPTFSGDIFEATEVRLVNGSTARKTVLVVQHPCALRADGVSLVGALLVAEVRRHKMLEPDEWRGYQKLMPLPELLPAVESTRRHQAAFFEKLHLVSPESLGDRVACLSPLGVNLLLQRWVHHNSRVVVPTTEFDLVTTGPYEEADLTEEWCETRLEAGLDLDAAVRECHDWLREAEIEDGPLRQALLGDRQRRGAVRRSARQYVRKAAQESS